MPAQNSPASSPAVSRPSVSLAKICSVVLVFVAMLAAACVPMQVSWLWLLLPLVFLIYLDAASSTTFIVSALMSPSVWLFYGGLVAAALSFEFGGLHQQSGKKLSAAGGGAACGCGSGGANVAVAAPNGGGTAFGNPPSRGTSVSALPRPNPVMRPVAPNQPTQPTVRPTTSTAMPPRKAAALPPSANPGTPASSSTAPVGAVVPTVPAGQPAVESSTIRPSSSARPVVPAQNPAPASTPAPTAPAAPSSPAGPK